MTWLGTSTEIPFPQLPEKSNLYHCNLDLSRVLFVFFLKKSFLRSWKETVLVSFSGKQEIPMWTSTRMKKKHDFVYSSVKGTNARSTRSPCKPQGWGLPCGRAFEAPITHSSRESSGPLSKTDVHKPLRTGRMHLRVLSEPADVTARPLSIKLERLKQAVDVSYDWKKRNITLNFKKTLRTQGSVLFMMCIECFLCKLTGHTWLGRMVDVLASRAATPGNLDGLKGETSGSLKSQMQILASGMEKALAMAEGRTDLPGHSLAEENLGGPCGQN